MTEVGRIVKFTALEGEGDALASGLLDVAAGMAGVDGCSLYLISRSAGDADVVWVLERWESQQHVEDALARPAAREQIPQILGYLKPDGFERFELEPLGGFSAETR